MIYFRSLFWDSNKLSWLKITYFRVHIWLWNWKFWIWIFCQYYQLWQSDKFNDLKLVCTFITWCRIVFSERRKRKYVIVRVNWSRSLIWLRSMLVFWVIWYLVSGSLFPHLKVIEQWSSILSLFCYFFASILPVLGTIDVLWLQRFIFKLV